MKRDWVDRWAGRTVVCIASGPSLTAADCELVRSSGHPAIVTNTTFKLCPWAEVLFAFDAKWWQHYHAEVKANFKGACLTYCAGRRFEGVETMHKQEAWFRHFHNSGASAVSLAICGGAAKVVMLGFDCQKTGGKAHWHGDHPATMGNARSIGNWPTQFKNLARYAESKKANVINASRETALKCFPRAPLESVL